MESTITSAPMTDVATLCDARRQGPVVLSDDENWAMSDLVNVDARCDKSTFVIYFKEIKCLVIVFS